MREESFRRFPLCARPTPDLQSHSQRLGCIFQDEALDGADSAVQCPRASPCASKAVREMFEEGRDETLDRTRARVFE